MDADRLVDLLLANARANVRANDDLFVYMGGDQQVPRNVRYVRIHGSVKIIRTGAFFWCRHLVSVEMHDGVEIIEDQAFWNCVSLRGINLTGVKVIGASAFNNCEELADVDFGEKLETIGQGAFCHTALRRINLPKVRTIGDCAFGACEQLTDVELSEDLETIGSEAFDHSLRRIAMPLKGNLLYIDNDVFGSGSFDCCENLSQVDVVGRIHKTVSSLLLDSWKNEMKDEIGGINDDLSNAYDKTTEIQEWLGRVLEKIEHYKSKHYALLKESTTLLELALWKAKLDEFGEAFNNDNEANTAKKAKIDVKAARQEKRITSGANIVVKNVLPFLKLE
jgi:hypothetical protein